jgi:hypothetical protein
MSAYKENGVSAVTDLPPHPLLTGPIHVVYGPAGLMRRPHRHPPMRWGHEADPTSLTTRSSPSCSPDAGSFAPVGVVAHN